MVRKFPHIALFIALFTIFSSGFSQTTDENSLRESAQNLFESEQYEQAFPLYSRLLSLRLDNADYNFHFGACQLYVGHEKEQALNYLKFATEQKEVPALAYFYYGLGLHLNYRFDKAIDFYQKYKSLASKKDRELKLVDTYINQCVNGKTLVSNFTDISVVQREVLPVRDFYRNYDLSQFGGKIIVKPEEFMSEEDMKRDANFLMYFQKDADMIYYGSFSDKNATGKDLYFISKLPTGGWSKPQRLSDVINTPMDEDYPFIATESNTLYFASKGHNSMGGYDIFKSTRRGDGSWTQPVNMEFAINTPWDDFMFITDKDEKTAWFSSNRETGIKDVTVYKIGIQRVPLDLTLIKGEFEHDASRKATITIEDMIQNKKVGVYESNGQDGSYLIDLRGSGKYKFIVEAKESKKAHTGIVEVPRQKGLKQFRQEMKLVMVNGEEQLQIINHFDEPLEGESLLTAEILKKQASLKVNADETSVLAIAEGESGNSAVSTKTKPQRLAEAKNQQKELEGDAELMHQKAKYLFDQAIAKESSSDPSTVIEAAIAIELASMYNAEAERRQIASDKMANTLSLLEGNSLGDDAFNAQMNQATTTAGNFNKLEAYDSELPVVFEERLKPATQTYASKKAEVEQLRKDVKALDEEISYLKSELASTKDKDLKEEYKIQIEEAEAAKPIKTAALGKAEYDLTELENQKKSADQFMFKTKRLLGQADEKGETTTGTVSTAEINGVKQEIAEKTKDNETLASLLTPTSGEIAAYTRPVESPKTNTNASSSSNPIASGTDSESNSSGSELAANSGESNSGNETNANPTDNATRSNSNPENGSNGNDLAANNPINSNADNSVNSGEAENEVGNATAAGTNNNPTENQPNNGGGNQDLNAAIRNIENSDSKTEIVKGDYQNYFEKQLAEANNDEDRLMGESRKAEIFDQWIESIDYRIDSLNAKMETESDPDIKAQLSTEVANLKTERQGKETLSAQSYEAIAELSDAAALGNSTANTGQNSNAINQPIVETQPKTRFDEINVKYEKQLSNAHKISDPLDRKTEEAAVNKAWASELDDRKTEINSALATETDAEKRASLESELALTETQFNKKEQRYEELEKQAQSMAAGENQMLSQAEFESKMTDYIENYDRQSFVNLLGDININPDENQRIVQTNTMTRNWMISLRNQIIKTEARKRNTNDPQQIQAINQELVELERDKIEVQAKLDSLKAGKLENAPAASANVVVKGSERFEGYQNVIDNQTIDDLNTAAKEKEEAYNDLAATLEGDRIELNNTKKKAEIEVLEENIARKEQNLVFAKLDKEAAQKEQLVVSQVESDLLQMEAGDDTPAEREAKLAAALLDDADAKMRAAQTKQNEAQAVKKKKDKEAALAAVETEMNQARIAKHQAELAEQIAERALAVESKAIRENFIIPRGKEAILPVVTRTLNPAEQADVAATSEFQSYDSEIKRAAQIRQEANQLEQLEISLQEQAQQKLTQLGGSSPAERAVQSRQAFDLFAKADSVSAAQAIKKREAAFIENEANKQLLTKPEEVYMNVLAYYNTVGRPSAAAPTLADANRPANDNNTAANNAATNENNTANSSGNEIAGSETGTNETGANDIAVNDAQNAIDNSGNNPTNNTAPNTENAAANRNETGSQNIAYSGNNSTNNTAENGTNSANQNNVAANNNQPANRPENNGSANDAGNQNPFDLLPPTTGNNGNNQRVNVSNDVLTNTIFDLAPDARNNFNGPVETANTNQQIPIDPVMPAGVVYKVQVGAFSKPIEAARFKGIKPIVGERTPSGYIRYTAGQFPDFASAEAALAELKQIGFPDAFIVGYQNGVRTPIEQVRQFEGKPANQVPVPAVATTNNTPANRPTTNAAPSIVRQGELRINDVAAQGEIFYTVQVGVFSRTVTSAEVYNITPLNEERMPNGNFRYSSGVYNNFTTADQAKQEIRNIGIKDAFVVAYRNGQRVTVDQARQALNDNSPAFTGVASQPVANNNPRPAQNNTPAPTDNQNTTSAQYRVLLGSYTGEIPIDQAAIILSLSTSGIEKVKDGIGKSNYYYGTYATQQEAEAEAARLRSQGLTQAKAERL